ncbi:hypothetical protein TNCT_389821 [Trichonephila clavata]|uniref:Uncharacterized protein n=1 Tax=Trichonephila clavata TaxID=2740835 RepID=A0A8X6GFT7_TRICU|nr:hypothetical protein TNCT_389821 [Trichonephila clavata]
MLTVSDEVYVEEGHLLPEKWPPSLLQVWRRTSGVKEGVLLSSLYTIPSLSWGMKQVGGGIDFARRWLALLHKTLANGVFEKPSSPVETRYPQYESNISIRLLS